MGHCATLHSRGRRKAKGSATVKRSQTSQAWWTSRVAQPRRPVLMLRTTFCAAYLTSTTLRSKAGLMRHQHANEVTIGSNFLQPHRERCETMQSSTLFQDLLREVFEDQAPTGLAKQSTIGLLLDGQFSASLRYDPV